MTKKILIILGICIIVGAVVVAFRYKRGEQLAQQEIPQAQILWAFTEKGEDESGIPHTEVTLIYNEKGHSVGTYVGTCSEIDGTNWTLQPGEKSGVICWYAGGGDEIGVFEEGGSIVVKKGQLDEGTAEEPGVRGNFQVLLSL